MCKSQHYEEEGVLLNKKSRTLLVVIELLSRHLVIPGFVKLMEKKRGENMEKQEWQLWL